MSKSLKNDRKDLSKLEEQNTPRKIIRFKNELHKLQVELVKMQRWVQENGQRIIVIFEGRDAAGKGGAIKRFAEHLNPRAMRIVALPKPTEIEKGQWYFQKYVRNLPNPGEIVFFDRSWYNRAVVEPVNGFCTKEEYKRFIKQVPEFEKMLLEAGIILIKFWFSIDKQTQLQRFEERRTNPLKNWKQSEVDSKAQDLWDEYTRYKKKMFKKTHSDKSQWIIVDGNDKNKARKEAMKHVLRRIPYDSKPNEVSFLKADSKVIFPYFQGWDSPTSI